MNMIKHTESLLCNNFIRVEANRIAKETPPSFLISEEAKEEKIYHEIKKIYDENVLLAVESLEIIVNQLQTMDCPPQVLKEIWSLETKGDVLEPHRLEEALKLNSFSEILGLSPPTLEWMYKVVDHFLRKGEAEKAVQSLYILNLICPENGLYWLSLGHSYYTLKQYDKALEAYQKSYMADPVDPRGLIWMAHTYEALGHPQTALEIVDELVNLLRGEETFSDLEVYQRKLQGARV